MNEPEPRYLCPAKDCPGEHRSKRDICLDRDLPAVQTPTERPGYFRGAKISKPVSRKQQS